MPGDNCTLVGYGSCQRSMGIGIWSLPASRNEEYKKWRGDWSSELTKFRKVDNHCQKIVDSDRVYTCEKHFAADDIEICKCNTTTVVLVFVFSHW